MYFKIHLHPLGIKKYIILKYIIVQINLILNKTVKM